MRRPHGGQVVEVDAGESRVAPTPAWIKTTLKVNTGDGAGGGPDDPARSKRDHGRDGRGTHPHLEVLKGGNSRGPGA